MVSCRFSPWRPLLSWQPIVFIQRQNWLQTHKSVKRWNAAARLYSVAIWQIPRSTERISCLMRFSAVRSISGLGFVPMIRYCFIYGKQAVTENNIFFRRGPWWTGGLHGIPTVSNSLTAAASHTLAKETACWRPFKTIFYQIITGFFESFNKCSRSMNIFR